MLGGANLDSLLFIYIQSLDPYQVTEQQNWSLFNAYRHGLGLKTGILNAANGNCLFDSISKHTG